MKKLPLMTEVFKVNEALPGSPSTARGPGVFKKDMSRKDPQKAFQNRRAETERWGHSELTADEYIQNSKQDDTGEMYSAPPDVSDYRGWSLQEMLDDHDAAQFVSYMAASYNDANMVQLADGCFAIDYGHATDYSKLAIIDAALAKELQTMPQSRNYSISGY